MSSSPFRALLAIYLLLSMAPATARTLMLGPRELHEAFDSIPTPPNSYVTNVEYGMAGPKLYCAVKNIRSNQDLEYICRFYTRKLRLAGWQINKWKGPNQSLNKPATELYIMNKKRHVDGAIVITRCDHGNELDIEVSLSNTLNAVDTTDRRDCSSWATILRLRTRHS